MRVGTNSFLTTVNIRDCVTLLYRMHIPIHSLLLGPIKSRREKGYWDLLTKERSEEVANLAISLQKNGHNLAGTRESKTWDDRTVPKWRGPSC